MLRTVFTLSAATLLMLVVPAAAQYTQTPAQPETQPQTRPAQKDTQAPSSAQTATEGLAFYMAQASDIRASDLIGMRVYNAADENLGEIEDLILDDGKNVKGIVLGVGGFLGVGERTVAVEPGSVTIQRQADGSERALVHATKENLDTAPELKRQADAR